MAEKEISMLPAASKVINLAQQRRAFLSATTMHQSEREIPRARSISQRAESQKTSSSFLLYQHVHKNLSLSCAPLMADGLSNHAHSEAQLNAISF
jgi:hypothetical protein